MLLSRGTASFISAAAHLDTTLSRARRMQSLVQVCIFDTRKRNKSKLFVSPPHCGVARRRPREVTLKLLKCRGGDIYFLPTAMRVALLRGVSTDMAPAPPFEPSSLPMLWRLLQDALRVVKLSREMGPRPHLRSHSRFSAVDRKMEHLRQTKGVAEIHRSSIACVVACVYVVGEYSGEHCRT